MRKSRRFEWITAIFFLAMGFGWTYIFGKDINFDFRNYHLYAGAALVDWRLNLDYFPAAIGGYLNPISSLPIYGMVMAGWDDYLIASMLMLMHMPNMLIVWKITEAIVPGTDQTALFCRVASTFLAFIAPLQLTTLSNTFADPIAGTFTLLGLYALVVHAPQNRRAVMVAAGFMFGLGAGLKLTNLFFLLAGFFTSLVPARKNPNAMLRGLFFAGGSAAGFGLAYGFWALALWAKFKNPIFPLYNSIFKSPDFLARNFVDERMLHDGLWSWVTLPFTMLSSRGMMYAENPAPDIRLICTVGVAMAAGLALLLRRAAPARFGQRLSATEQTQGQAPLGLILVCVFFLASYLLWGVFSGIGRYAYVLWLLLGPILIALLKHFFNASVLRVTASIVIIVQVTVQLMNPGLAWSPQKWGGKWVNLDVAAELKNEPATYLLYGAQSNSFIAPYLHPKSKFSNFIGQYVQPVGEEMHAQFKEFLRNRVGPVRIVVGVRGTDGATEIQPATRDGLDALLSGYGFRIKSPNCYAINLMGEALPKVVDGDWQASWAERKADLTKIIDTSLACDLIETTSQEQEQALSEYKRMDKYFDSVEKACGRALSPHGVQTFNGGGRWYRMYFNSLVVLIAQGDDIWAHPNETLLDIPITKISEINAGNEISCPDIQSIKNSAQITFRPNGK